MSTRMSSYSTSRSKDDRLTMWDVFERAAKRRYGSHIRVVKAPWVNKQIDNLQFEVSVVRADLEPKEKTRTIADINMKEYINNSDTSVDESVVKVSKRRRVTIGNRYQFSTTQGVNWNLGGNIGAQVMGLAMAGGNASVGGSYGKQKSTTTENEQNEARGAEHSYEQEEKIYVQPMTKATAIITTYAMKYEQGYTIKISLPRDLSLNVMYKNRWNQMCCGASWGRLSSSDLLYELPGYSEDEETVSFLQDGTLSWIGEGSKIEKTVESLVPTAI